MGLGPHMEHAHQDINDPAQTIGGELPPEPEPEPEPSEEPGPPTSEDPAPSEEPAPSTSEEPGPSENPQPSTSANPSTPRPTTTVTRTETRTERERVEIHKNSERTTIRERHTAQQEPVAGQSRGTIISVPSGPTGNEPLPTIK